MASDPFKNLTIRRKAGETIFTEGDLGSEMYVVQSGEVRLFRMREGIKQELAILEKGDFFGELAVLEGLPRTSCAEALKDAELIEINSTTFDRMIRANIEIAVRMLRKLSNRLQEATHKLEALAQAPAAGRAAAAAAEPVDMDRPPDPPPPPPALIPEVSPAPAPAAAPAPSRGAAPPPATGPAGIPDVAVPKGALAILVLEGGSKIFTIAAAAAVIGRYDPVTGQRPEIDLTQVDINRSVSRRHARLQHQDGAFYLSEEVGALNGTLVNGRRLVPGQPQVLAPGDRIAVGMVALVYKAAS
ncbi:MAG TPA: cyclic nucleotide-binding domain-containing protein [Candidatus Polarisedimenticolia bacterium]|jgi:pSer/pThr/pTyr-binding forkhead associated (FHA) protein|nr:cyclic nucleotide-binding domain-containing protein [Candidatus Polarisedimenticolia bacterium]